MYVSFFHGREDPDEDMEGWGEPGPIVGPVEVSWTYGSIKVHNEWNEDFIDIPQYEGMVKLGDMYYGDFEVWTNNDKLLKHPTNTGRIISYEEFKSIVNQTVKN